MSIRKISEDTIQAEHVRTTFRQFPVGIAVHALNAAFVVGLLWWLTDSSRAALASWFTVILALCALRGVAMRLYLRSQTQSSGWRGWSRVAAVVLGAFGVAWAAAIALFLDIGAPASLILLTVIPIGLTAGSASTNAARADSHLAFVLPIVLTLTVVLLATGTPLGVGLGILAIMNTLGNVAIWRNVFKALDQSLRLQFKNEELREEAERANAAKTRFLAAASHDLRQPMHALGLFFSALVERVQTKETKPLIEHIEETIGVISSMLNALLDISKLDAGVVEPNVGTIEIAALFRRLDAEFSVSARESGNRLRFRSCTARVRTDSAVLERILRNLIGDALQFTKSGRVLVAGRRRGTNLRIEVWDTGCGIPEDRRDEVFLEFQQLGNPQRDRRQGLGLGLAIVRRAPSRSELDCGPRLLLCRDGTAVERLRVPIPDASGIAG